MLQHNIRDNRSVLLQGVGRSEAQGEVARKNNLRRDYMLCTRLYFGAAINSTTFSTWAPGATIYVQPDSLIFSLLRGEGPATTSTANIEGGGGSNASTTMAENIGHETRAASVMSRPHRSQWPRGSSALVGFARTSCEGARCRWPTLPSASPAFIDRRSDISNR